VQPFVLQINFWLLLWLSELGEVLSGHKNLQLSNCFAAIVLVLDFFCVFPNSVRYVTLLGEKLWNGKPTVVVLWLLSLSVLECPSHGSMCWKLSAFVRIAKA
jgi:hypothetical protein